MMEEGFFCDVLGWLQLSQFSFVYFLCDTVQCIVCLSHTVFHFWKEFGWVLFCFRKAGLDLAIEVFASLPEEG